MSNFKLFVLLGLICATLAHYRGHHEEGDYDDFFDDSIYDDDYFHDVEHPHFNTGPKVHEKSALEDAIDEMPFKKTKHITEDPNKGIMTLEERHPVKRAVRIHNKQRAKDPKYRKGLQELAGLM